MTETALEPVALACEHDRAGREETASCCERAAGYSLEHLDSA